MTCREGTLAGDHEEAMQGARVITANSQFLWKYDYQCQFETRKRSRLKKGTRCYSPCSGGGGALLRLGRAVAPPCSTFHIRCSAFATSISNGFVRREVPVCTSSHIRFAQSTLISTAPLHVRIPLQHATVFLPSRSMHNSRCPSHHTEPLTQQLITHANIPHTYINFTFLTLSCSAGLSQFIRRTSLPSLGETSD
jgi:hypothetical protein